MDYNKTRNVHFKPVKGETIEMTQNKSVLNWIENMKELVIPDNVVWITGEESQLEDLRKEACTTGEMIKLNQEKLPGLLSAPHGRERCGPRGGPHLHLLPQGRGRRPDEPLDGPRKGLQDAL